MVSSQAQVETQHLEGHDSKAGKRCREVVKRLAADLGHSSTMTVERLVAEL